MLGCDAVGLEALFYAGGEEGLCPNVTLNRDLREPQGRLAWGTSRGSFKARKPGGCLGVLQAYQEVVKTG